MAKAYQYLKGAFKAQTLQEGFPKHQYLHLMQPRLDQAGHTLHDMFKHLEDTGVWIIPIEIWNRGEASVLTFVDAMGWTYLSQMIVQAYPNT